MASNLTMGSFLLKNWQMSMFRGLLPETNFCASMSSFSKKILKILLLRNRKVMKLKIVILALDIVLYKSYDFYSGQIKTLVAMATYCFQRLITGKVEIGNFYCLIVDNRILFLQKSLLNSSPHFIRLLTILLNLIGCRCKLKSKFSIKKSVSQEP